MDRDKGAVTWFEKASVMMNRFLYSTENTWEKVLTMLRFTLFSHGILQGGDRAEVERRFKLACEQYPDQAVVVIDLLAENVKHRLILMNDLAQEHRGKFLPEQGGVDRMMFPQSEHYKLLRVAFKCWMFPYADHEFHVTEFDPNGELRQATYWVHFHDDLKVVITRSIRVLTKN